jgi:putative transcriptional regulator
LPASEVAMGTNIKLKLARVERGLSQQDLADKVKATRQTIGLIEKGDFNPSLGLCIRIAKALGKTLDQLFWEEEKDERSRAASR